MHRRRACTSRGSARVRPKSACRDRECAAAGHEPVAVSWIRIALSRRKIATARPAIALTHRALAPAGATLALDRLPIAPSNNRIARDNARLQPAGDACPAPTACLPSPGFVFRTSATSCPARAFGCRSHPFDSATERLAFSASALACSENVFAMRREIPGTLLASPASAEPMSDSLGHTTLITYAGAVFRPPPRQFGRHWWTVGQADGLA
jgi:hypothetical protein